MPEPLPAVPEMNVSGPRRGIGGNHDIRRPLRRPQIGRFACLVGLRQAATELDDGKREEACPLQIVRGHGDPGKHCSCPRLDRG